MQIIPTITEKDFSRAEERLLSLSGLATWVQLDVADNIFTTGKSFELELVDKFVGNEKFLWDVHLITKEPISWMEKCMFIGASRIIGQVEMMANREEFIKKIKDEGLEAGLAFDIETKVDKIAQETDVVLLMGRKAGFGWFELDKRVLEKVKILKQVQDDKGLGFKIAVDGGATMENIDELEKAGVDIVYCGDKFMEIYASKNE